MPSVTASEQGKAYAWIRGANRGIVVQGLKGAVNGVGRSDLKSSTTEGYRPVPV